MTLLINTELVFLLPSPNTNFAGEKEVFVGDKRNNFVIKYQPFMMALSEYPSK